MDQCECALISTTIGCDCFNSDQLKRLTPQPLAKDNQVNKMADPIEDPMKLMLESMKTLLIEVREEQEKRKNADKKDS